MTWDDLQMPLQKKKKKKGLHGVKTVQNKFTKMISEFGQLHTELAPCTNTVEYECTSATANTCTRHVKHDVLNVQNVKFYRIAINLKGVRIHTVYSPHRMHHAVMEYRRHLEIPLDVLHFHNNINS
jgi:hypothetical protein